MPADPVRPDGLHAQVHGFGAAADAYERARPGYPPDAVAHLLAVLAVDATTVVTDVAAGTGKLTRELAGRAGRVIAVEPVPGMRRVLARRLPRVEVVDGRAEDLPLPDGSVDAVTVAQAFHWFDGPAALAEFDRVLRGAGRLALVWNERDESTDVQAALSRLLAPYRGETPSYRSGRWREAFAASDRFAPLEEATFTASQTLDRARLIDRVASTSFVATLPEDERLRIADRVGRLFDGHAAGDRVELRYITRVQWTRASARHAS